MSPGAVLVTGASRGIGRAVAERLLDAGREVVLVATDEAKLEEVAARAPERAHVLARDLIADPNVVGVALERVEALEGLVHAAGIAPHAPLFEIRERDVERCHRLHVVAPLISSRDFARHRLSRGGDGSIVHVASTLGLRTAPGRLVYAATKAALLSMTRTLSLELAAHRIRVNAVAPGVVDTDMARDLDASPEALAALHPLGRLGTPEEIAEAIEYLLCARWVTGSVLTIDGGLTAG